MQFNTPQEALHHHVNAAIARGEKPVTEVRPLYVIALDISTHWPKVNYAARPYLDAMSSLTKITDTYICDPADHIVRYFLANANTWRGEDAKRIKAELKSMLPY